MGGIEPTTHDFLNNIFAVSIQNKRDSFCVFYYPESTNSVRPVAQTISINILAEPIPKPTTFTTQMLVYYL